MHEYFTVTSILNFVRIVSYSCLFWLLLLWFLRNVCSMLAYRKWSTLEGQRVILPSRYRTCSWRLFVYIFLPWHLLLIALRLLRRKSWLFFSNARFSENDDVRAQVVAELKDANFVQKLRELHFRLAKNELLGELPEVLLESELASASIGWLVVDIPLQFGGIAARVQLSGRSQTMLAIEPSGLGDKLVSWCRAETIRHEICHFLQDKHASIFSKELNGTVGFFEGVGFETQAHAYGSPRTASLVVIPLAILSLCFLSVLAFVGVELLTGKSF